MSTIYQQQGSAAINGELWGERARDWAELQEGERRHDFAVCIRRTGIAAGAEVLDLGYGAGLRTVVDGVAAKAYEYPDLDTALRAIRSAGMTLLAERTAGEGAVTDAIARGLAPYRTPAGGYRLEVQSRYIRATSE